MRALFPYASTCPKCGKRALAAAFYTGVRPCPHCGARLVKDPVQILNRMAAFLFFGFVVMLTSGGHILPDWYPQVGILTVGLATSLHAIFCAHLLPAKDKPPLHVKD